MNNNFTLHIVRDVFGQKICPMIYGRDTSLLETFYLNEHSMGATLVYSSGSFISHFNPVASLDINKNLNPDALGFFDFLISINYDYDLDPPYCDRVGKMMKSLLKPSSQIFLVNPGTWSFCFDDYFERFLNLEREVKKYSMFKDEKVFVYENI